MNFNPLLFLEEIISLYLLKSVVDGMGGYPLGKKVTRMPQSLTSMILVITVSWMLKSMHVELFPYLALKASMYYMICQSATYTDT